MALLPSGQVFDANEVDPFTAFEPLPKGRYPVIAVDSEMKSTKSGEGQYLQLVFEVIDGEFKGRKLFSRLNLLNKNPTAQDIAYRELSAICRACGVMKVQDSAELHGRPLAVDVIQETNPQNGEPTNRIKAYQSLSGAAPAPAAVSTGTTPASYAAATGRSQAAQAPQVPAAPPWKRTTGKAA